MTSTSSSSNDDSAKRAAALTLYVSKVLKHIELNYPEKVGDTVFTIMAAAEVVPEEYRQQVQEIFAEDAKLEAQRADDALKAMEERYKEVGILLPEIGQPMIQLQDTTPETVGIVPEPVPIPPRVEQVPEGYWARIVYVDAVGGSGLPVGWKGCAPTFGGEGLKEEVVAVEGELAGEEKIHFGSREWMEEREREGVDLTPTFQSQPQPQTIPPPPQLTREVTTVQPPTTPSPEPEEVDENQDPNRLVVN